MMLSFPPALWHIPPHGKEVAECVSWSSYRGYAGHAPQEKIQRLHDDLLIHARCAEDVAFRRQRAEKSAAQILTAVANVWGVEVVALRRRQYRCPARAVAARMLWAHAGLNQRQIGRLLQMGTGAPVSAHLRRLERAMATDPKLQARCAVIDSRLNVDC